MNKEQIKLLDKEIEKLKEPINKLINRRHKIREKLERDEDLSMIGKYFQRGSTFIHILEMKNNLLWGVCVYRNNTEPCITWEFAMLKYNSWREISKEKYRSELNKVLIKFRLKKVRK